MKRLMLLAAAAGAGLALAGCGGGSSPSHTVSIARPAASSGGSASSLQQSFIGVIQKVSPEVVQIQTPQGLGSGIVFDSQGDIVTNDHVVTGGPPFRITSSQGRTYSGTLVGTFAEDDLAVVRAKNASLPPATFANSRNVQVGDLVLAIGNPLGLRSSVTDGIISAVGREVSEPTGAVLPDTVQTSAPINPGNSGGALVDLQGQVVGIPTLAATDPELGSSAAPGIGFAIPSSIVTDIAGQLVKYGHVVNSHRAYLGVELASGNSSGAVVAAVQRGGPAAKAGISAGELIASIAGHAIAQPEDVAAVLATLRPGQTVSVQVESSDGTKRTVKVTLGQYPGRS